MNHTVILHDEILDTVRMKSFILKIVFQDEKNQSINSSV